MPYARLGTDTPFTIGGTAAGYAYPGAPGQTVTLTAYNNSTGNEAIGSPIYLASVNACPEGTTYQSGSSDCWDGVALDAHVPALSDCQSVAPGNVANDTSKTWWMADVTTTQDFAPGVTTTIMPTGTLVMNDTTFNQNDCKNANLTLNFATR